MSVSLMPQGRQRYFANDATPAAGAKLYTYAAGTTNPKLAYTDAAGLVAHPNPIVLDAKGEAVIYWVGVYKVDLKAANGTQITGYPVDNLDSDPNGVSTIFPQLAQTSGAAKVGVPNAQAPAYLKTVSDLLNGDIVCADRFLPTAQIAAIRARTSVYNCAPDITAACAAFTNGGGLEFPPGDYLLSSGVVLNKAMKFSGAGQKTTRFVVDAALGAAVDAITAQSPNQIDAEEGFTFSDFQIIPAGGLPGRHGLNLGNGLYNGLSRCTVERVRVSKMGSYGIRNNGAFSSTIQNCTVAGILFDKGTDNLNVLGNTILGDFWGIYVDCVAGSNTLNIKDNVVVSKLGGVYLKNAGNATIADNQFEAQVATTDPDSSIIVVNGVDSDIYNCHIHGNNFNASPAFVQRTIKLIHSVSAHIHDNVLFTGPVAGGSRPIDILATSVGTRMGHNYYYSAPVGNYNFSQIAGCAYDATYNPNGTILDAGVGTCGVWKLLPYFSADITRNANYSELGVRKDLSDNLVMLQGGVNVANIADNKVIAVVPPGFRPQHDYTVVTLTGRAASTGKYYPLAARITNTDGGIYLQGVTNFAGSLITEIGFDGVSYSRVYA